jgi:hypothetical protein
MAYFVADHVDGTDSVNEQLWATSVNVQHAIQEPNEISRAGDIGAQQAMLRPGICKGIDEDSVLPWVPDIVGREWRSQDAVLVVGTAYAGFISEFSGRHQKNTIGLGEYHDLASRPVGVFQARFIETVINDDPTFYNRVSALLDGSVDPVKMALFDLCRASFMLRAEGDLWRKDISKERWTVCVKPEIYSEYVEWIADPEGEELGPRAWTWARIRDSEARRIIALGRVAEYGILRALKWNLTDFKVHLKSNPDASAELTLSERGWAGGYANPSINLRHWYPPSTNQELEGPEKVDWWCVTGSANGRTRAWFVLTVYHPSSREFDARIAESRKRIEIMLAEEERLRAGR